jgi:predicted enzyme related to lactoylglutathione lyase
MSENNPTAIIGIGFVTIYVDRFDDAFTFYNEVLGLEKSFDVDEVSCFFTVGGNQYGMLLRGGVQKGKSKPESSHTSFVMMVDSASKMHQKLRLNGTKPVHDEPLDMGEGDYWFQFPDPAGNVLEVLGGK